MKRIDVQASFSDKSERENSMRGKLNGDTITVWHKNFIKKKECSFTIDINELEQRLRLSFNENFTIRKIVKEKDDIAVKQWIDNTKDDRLREKRLMFWDDDPVLGRDGAANDRRVDSAARVVKYLYGKYKEAIANKNRGGD